ncbi:hypothetical protein GBF38_015399 [Nibea albiflora]|uniref:Uncharacterized protein n=1 Tax=Nibea albiflora TaxID=240163 RepID=A0ACB7EKR3_NIBAL|nr:hypothetical protein GBF38_015399 [Nibea albiflora]
MDVLLTNLIKGNLLPSALLWIISQPSGVDKIPRQYIEKVTECQGNKEIVISDFEKIKVLFVLDGLDAYQPPLDFDNNDTLTDIREPASVDVLLTNLIRGKPSFCQALDNLPTEAANSFVDRTTEIRCKPDIESKQKLKTQLKKQFTHVSEGVDMQKTSALLNDIYTDLYIVEGERGEVNDQHETRQVQDAKFKPVTQETLIKYHDIFKPTSGENKPIRTVLTIGVAGIGKSFATMKYMLDWAEGESSETDSCWNTRNEENNHVSGETGLREPRGGTSSLTEDDLTECGVDIKETAIFSGLFTQIKREGHGLYQQKLFCFVHLSIQEFLAAFYVFHAFNNKGENLLTKPASTVADLPASDFFKTAVDKAFR